jgi:hypothetical protein
MIYKTKLSETWHNKTYKDYGNSKEIFGDNKTYKVIFEVAPEADEEVSLPAIFLTTRTISSTTNLAPHLTKTKTRKNKTKGISNDSSKKKYRLEDG